MSDFGNELVDLDGALAFDRDGFQLVRIKLDVFALVDLEAFDDVGGFDFVAGFGIDLAIPNAVAGFLIELMEADLLAFAGRRIKRDRAGDERQLQIAFPVRTRGHGTLLYATQNTTNKDRPFTAAIRVYKPGTLPEISAVARLEPCGSIA